MSEVVNFTGITRLDMPTDRILEAAKGKLLESVFVCGYDSDGEFYAACSMADGGTALWLLETAKVRLLQAGQIIPTE